MESRCLRIQLTEAGIRIMYAVLYALHMNSVRRSAKTRCIGSVFGKVLHSKRICERSIVTSIGYFTGNGPIELVLCMIY